MTEDISLYIHIPFCKSKCIYCDFFSRPGCEDLINDYVDSLCNEIIFYSKKLSSDTVKTVYIGGGTPSLLSLEQIKKIIYTLKENFCFVKNDFEFTVELNPDDVTQELIQFFESSDVNRLSTGIQTLKDETLKLIKRRASKETCLNALKIISENFTKRFSVDLICSLPGENESDVKNSIDKVITFNPEHISLYSLCVEENTELYKLIKSGKIKYDASYADELWINVRDYLVSKGYSQYEVSNFSKDKKSQSRHNLTYWHLQNYLGLGSGATGTLWYDKKDSVRYTNSTDIKEYIDYWKSCNFKEEFFSGSVPLKKETIDKKTEEFEFFMMNLRLLEGFSKNEYEKRFNKKAEEIPVIKNGVFKTWQDKKLSEVIHRDADVFYRLTEKGILYLNSFLTEFL